MEQKKKVRLSDIADKLNVSTVTVSKALSNLSNAFKCRRKKITAFNIRSYFFIFN